MFVFVRRRGQLRKLTRDFSANALHINVSATPQALGGLGSFHHQFVIFVLLNTWSNREVRRFQVATAPPYQAKRLHHRLTWALLLFPISHLRSPLLWKWLRVKVQLGDVITVWYMYQICCSHKGGNMTLQCTSNRHKPLQGFHKLLCKQ